MNLSALHYTSFVCLLYSLHPLNLAGCCGRMLWGFPVVPRLVFSICFLFVVAAAFAAVDVATAAVVVAFAFADVAVVAFAFADVAVVAAVAVLALLLVEEVRFVSFWIRYDSKFFFEKDNDEQ